MKSAIGKWNISVGLWAMAAFMFYGFVLVYLRDFAPGKEEWIANYAIGDHFEARLAHVHGNLFALLNILFGFLMMQIPVDEKLAIWVSRLALTGLLMPIGILGEVYLNTTFVIVLLGGLSMFLAATLLGLAIIRYSKSEK